MWLLYCFAPLKTWFLDLHQVKIMCNADFKFQNHSLTISENLCIKNLKIIENDFFINVLKKINKHLAEKKFYCVWRHSMGRLELKIGFALALIRA